MGYDSSIIKRKGCNYCLRRKTIQDKEDVCSVTILDDKKELIIYDDHEEIIGTIKINYCPVCGKQLD